MTSQGLECEGYLTHDTIFSGQALELDLWDPFSITSFQGCTDVELRMAIHYRKQPEKNATRLVYRLSNTTVITGAKIILFRQEI